MADIESNIRFGVDTSDAIASIKTLQAQISAFQKQMASSSVANAESARKLRRGLIDDLNATGQWSASIKTIKSSTETFTTALEKNKLSMGEYFRYAGASTKTFGRLFTSEFNTIEKVARERVKDLQTQYISLGRDANGALKSIAVRPLKLDMSDLATQTAMTAQKQQIFNQLLKQGSTNLLNFGKNTQWAGRQLMVGFTIPLSIFGTMAAKSFMDLEKQAIRFKRVYGDAFSTDKETNDAIENMRRLAREFTKYGVEIEKTLELAADAAQMGLKGAELEAQVTEATRLAVLGEVEQQEALRTTISVTNAFGIAASDLAKKIDFLNAVENETVTAISDLTIAIPKAGPVVKQLGGGIEELAFLLTAMKEGGINASEGANALKSGMAALINPTEKSAQMLKVFGINVKEIRDNARGDIKKLVIDMANALDALDPSQRAQAIEQLFGKFQFARISTLFQNVIKEGTQAQKVLELSNATTSELAALSSKELKRVEQSTTFRFEAAIQKFQAAIAPVGEEFLKLITPIIEFATKIIDKFNSLSDGAKGFITGLVALLGLVGPVALMTFGLLANGIANIIKGFNFVREVFLRTGKQSQNLGEQFDYMTSEQLQAAAVAASLDQVHQQLIQTFTSEAGAVKNLGDIYRQAFNEQQRFDTGRRIAQQSGLRLASGIVSVPGPKGAGDVVPAMLSPGEAVIPAKAAKKYAPIIQGMIAGNIPGFSTGVFLGMPKKSKYVKEEREVADEIYARFLESNYKNVPPTNYGHQLAKSVGHSFPLFGVGGVYMSPAGKRVFVKPVLDEKAATAEIRATQIARQAHGLKAPAQRIVVMLDPTDVRRQRKFLALESELDSTFVNNDPMAVFNEDQYFKQLVASLLRVDKDLSASNVFGNVVADVGPAGVFTRASGLRDYADNLPSMEEQAMINLLGIRGGAKRAFAESTLALMANLTPEQYHQRMISEIQQVLPLLKQTIASFNLTDPREVKVYADMVDRLQQGLGVDWSKFHAIHSNVKISKKKQSAVPGYADGVVSVPGPKGKGDVVPAMLSPGEAVIPAKESKKYAPLIQAMIAGNVPGYNDGLFEKVSRSQLLQPLKQVIDNFDEVISLFVSNMQKQGKKITQQGINEGTLDPTLTRAAKIANTTSLGGRDLAGDGSSMSGVNLAHLSAKVELTMNQAHELGKLYQEAGYAATSAVKMLMEATGPISAYSNLVGNLTRAGNSGLMTGNEVASFMTSSDAQTGLTGTEVFLRPLIENYRIDANDPELMQWASNLVNEFTRAGDKAIDDSDIYRITYDSIQKLADSATKDALMAAANEYQTFADNSSKAGDPKRYNAPRGTSAVLGRNYIERAKSLSATSVGLNTEAIGIPYRDLRNLPARSPSELSFADFTAQANIMADNFAISLTKSLTSSVGKINFEPIGEIVAEKVKTGLGINSPSSEYENISNSVNQGVRMGEDDAQQAGQIIGESISDGALAAGPTQSGKPARRARGETVPGVGQIISNPTIPGDKEAKIDQKQQENLKKETQARQANNEKIAQASERLGRMNSLFMSGTFALSSLTGVLSLFGGQFAELNQQIFAISGAMFTLMQVIQQLTSATMLQLIMNRKAIAMQKLGLAADAKLFAGVSGFGAKLGIAGKFLGGFLGKLGIAIVVIGLLVGGIVAINNIIQEQKKKITGLGDTAFMTADKMKKAAALLGFEAKSGNFGDRSRAGGAAGITAEERTKIEELRASDSFKKDYADDINAIRNAANKEMAEVALSAIASQLFAAGANQEQVDALVRAIAQEAGRTNLVLDFAKIEFSETGAEQIAANAKEAGEIFSKVFEENVTATVTERTAAKDLFEAITRGATVTQKRVDIGTVSQKDVKSGQASIVITDEARQAAELYAGTLGAALKALEDGFANGLISAKDFNDKISEITSGIASLGEIEAGLILKPLYEKLGLTDTMKGITGISDQMLILQAITAGVSMEDLEPIMNVLKDGPGTDADSARRYNQATQKAIGLIRQQTTETEKLKKAEEEKKLVDDAVAAANVDLEQRTKDLLNQASVYELLMENGYEAADALELVGNATLVAGLAAAQAAGDLEKTEEILKNIAAYKEALAGAPKSPDSKGGAKDKTPFEEAIDSLKQQKKEIEDNSAAFSKLRKAGFDTASAMRAAEDPILAAALATTKVGTKAWNNLVKKIKEVQKLLNKKQMQDLLKGGKIEIAEKRAQLAASSALINLGYTIQEIDQVLADQEFTNTLAKDLKDGKINAKDLLNRLSQIKQLGKLDMQLDFRKAIQSDIDDQRGILMMQERFLSGQTKFNGLQQFAIQMDSTLSDAYAAFLSKGIPIPRNFGERLQQVINSVEFRTEAFENAFSKVGEIFAAQEEKLRIDLEFKLKGFKIEGVAGEGAREILAAAQEEIDKLQFELDDLNAGIQEIEWQEKEINEKYEERLKALDKIEKANANIAAQQKTQLGLADALSKGDIAAAAAAVQEIRSEQAQRFITDRKDRIELEKQKELEGLKSSSGKTRKELEAAILKIQKEIFAIEEKRLEPATEYVRLAELELDKNIKSLEVLGQTKLGWDKISNAAKLAVVESEAFRASLIGILSAMRGISFDADGKLIFNESEFKTNFQQPAASGTGTGTDAGNQAKQPSQTELIIQELNRRAAISRYRYYDPKANLTDQQKQDLFELNVKRLKKVIELGGIPDRTTRIEPGTTAQIIDLNSVGLRGYSSGGYVSARYMRMGGLLPYKAEGGSIFKPLGTDTVPAMLTPGEFVVRRSIAQKYLSELTALNSGKPDAFNPPAYGLYNRGTDLSKLLNNRNGDIRYNNTYKIDVNVATDANPNEIARAVMTQIKQIDSQRIRSNRY